MEHKVDNKKSGAGFTFLEALIAIAVLTIGIVAVVQMFPISIQMRKLAEMQTVASQLAQEKMEEFISKSYPDISSEATTTLSSPFEAYSRAVRVTCLNPNLQQVACDYDPDNDPNPVKKIEVIVYWESPLGVTKKDFKIATLISKR